MKVAILDMYNGTPNYGMKAITDIVSRYGELEFKIYDVRTKCDVPGLDYDMYIFSGGPGSPLEGGGIWERAFYYLVEKLWKHNQVFDDKKYAFFVCHSFQMACIFLSLGSIVYRKSPSSGILRMRLTEAGKNERTFRELPDPFYAADFRKWQFIEPDPERMKRLGCQVLAIEKDRPHVDLERAIMAIRFSPEWIGTQFHPEADPPSMMKLLQDPDKKKEYLEQKGKERYDVMVENARNPGRLQMTYDNVIPGFLEDSMRLTSEYRSIQKMESHES